VTVCHEDDELGKDTTMESDQERTARTVCVLVIGKIDFAVHHNDMV